MAEQIDARTLFRDASAHGGRTVALRGWLRTVRAGRTLAFLELGDGSTVRAVQVVADASLPGFAALSKLGAGAAVLVRGELVLTPEARQPFEIRAQSVEVEGTCAPDYPLQKKRHSMEYLRTVAHLRPRARTFQSVFRVRSEAAFAVHDFFHRRNFVLVHTPIVTGSDAEGAGEMFRVTTLDAAAPPRTPDGHVDFAKDFFGKQTGLTVSGQLEAEAFALAFAKTYTFGPAFRAENSNTPRHAAEFWMIEPEIAFADLRDDMCLAEDLVKYIIAHVLAACPEEMEFFDKFIDPTLLARLAAVRDSTFARMTYTEAVEVLSREADRFTYPVSWGADLQTEHERFLTEQVVRRPVFVTDYPREIKAFYMRQNDDGKTVAAMDLLVPVVGELVGGSQREERADVLAARLRALGLPEADYAWYLDLRRFGGVRHAGFGLGFERMLMYLTGMANIRDVVAFPRTSGSAEF
ncbi:MAG: asparagine--tRNA ligase [Oscillospiraceae bacterium]|jgi:asparaginyl-tRNA synthetase|nr:asparagine--tRNA ligase [Oscillospiraceae bacterium]